MPALEHSNSRFESIRFVMRIDSFSKKNRPFDSLVVMQFFLVYFFLAAISVRHHTMDIVGGSSVNDTVH